MVDVISSRYKDLVMANIEKYPSVPKPEYNGFSDREKDIYADVFTAKDLSLRIYKAWQNDTTLGKKYKEMALSALGLLRT